MPTKNRSGTVSIWFDHCLNALTVVAGLVVVFVALAICCDVVARYFFNAPISWVFNLSQDLLIYFVFLATAWVLREGGHVKIDLLETRLKPRQGDFLRLATSVMAMVACGVLFWSSVNAVLSSFRWGTILPGPPAVHEYILLAVIPFGSFLLVVQFGRDCWKYINKLRRRC